MSLDAPALRSLSRLLDQALDLEPAACETWLASLVGDDALLGPRLRHLLARRAEQSTADFAAPIRAIVDAAADPASDDRIGPYRLLRELGSGGMGAVWLAERIDGQLQRQVALKLPHIGWTPGLAERFAREREILATLEHPNIARLYDAGLDARGRPYMALEYVEGRPIDEYCRDGSLSVTERLSLLEQVADAVVYAHRHLVLHRDLKPGNILVTADGQVRLLDFGIAKLMEGGRAEETALTQAAGRAMTLDYASPEQIRGAPIGTASDVYSLGVVAFEILTGERPYRLKRGSAAELEEAITAQEPAQASTVVHNAALKRALRGDLDAILNKALKKKADDRYPTVDALAADWRRYQEGQRVLARPDTARYRAGRLLSRHRVPLAGAALAIGAFVLAIGFGAAAVVIVALSLGLGGALLQTRRATTERDRAIELANRNAAVNQFLDTLLTRAARAGPLTASQLLERSERLIERETLGNAGHRAYVLGVLANCHSQLDNPARAVELLERAVEVARTVADRPLRDSLSVRRALLRGQLGDFDRAIGDCDAILGEPGTTPEVRSEAHNNRSILASWKGDDADALSHATQALRWFGASRLTPPRQEAVLLGNLGWAKLMQAQTDDAERHFSQAMAVYEKLGLADSPQAVQLIGNWGLAMQEIGDLDGSLELLDRALEISGRVAPDSTPSPYVLCNRAYTLTQMGRYAEAEAGYRAGADVARRQQAPLLVETIRLCAVEAYAEQGRLDDGARELAETDAERNLDVPDGAAATFARQLAEARLALLRGEPDAAIALYSEALVNERASAGSINARLGRAEAYVRAARFDDAAADANTALTMARQMQGARATSFRTGLSLTMLARAHEGLGQVDDARRHAGAARQHLGGTLDPGHPAMATLRRIGSPG